MEEVIKIVVRDRIRFATAPCFSWSKATESTSQEAVVHVIEVVVTRNIGTVTLQIVVKCGLEGISGERCVAVTSPAVKFCHDVASDTASTSNRRRET